MQFVRLAGLHAILPRSLIDNRHPTPPREATKASGHNHHYAVRSIGGTTEMMCARVVGAVRLRVPYAPAKRSA